MSSRSPETELAPIGVEQVLRYLTIGALSCLVVTILERLAAGLEGVLLRTEIYSIHGFSHVFFGIGLASIILFLRPRSTARVVILGVQKRGLRWWGLYAWETGIHAVRTGVFCSCRRIRVRFGRVRQIFLHRLWAMFGLA